LRLFLKHKILFFEQVIRGTAKQRFFLCSECNQQDELETKKIPKDHKLADLTAIKDAIKSACSTGEVSKYFADFQLGIEWVENVVAHKKFHHELSVNYHQLSRFQERMAEIK